MSFSRNIKFLFFFRRDFSFGQYEPRELFKSCLLDPMSISNEFNIQFSNDKWSFCSNEQPRFVFWNSWWITNGTTRIAITISTIFTTQRFNSARNAPGESTNYWLFIAITTGTQIFLANRKLSASANSQSETFCEKVESFIEIVESFF